MTSNSLLVVVEQDEDQPQFIRMVSGESIFPVCADENEIVEFNTPRNWTHKSTKVVLTVMADDNSKQIFGNVSWPEVHFNVMNVFGALPLVEQKDLPIKMCEMPLEEPKPSIELKCELGYENYDCEQSGNLLCKICKHRSIIKYRSKRNRRDYSKKKNQRSISSQKRKRINGRFVRNEIDTTTKEVNSETNKCRDYVSGSISSEDT
jgi:hypothetical protein